MVISQLKNRVRFTGLTGGIASGKSRAASFMAERFGLLFYSTDKIAHDLLVPGKEGWHLVRDINPDFINPDGTINKPLFRSVLFEDKELRKKVDAEIHPLVWEVLVKKVKSQLVSFEEIPVLVEVPLLYEAGWQGRFDEVIVVYTEKENCLDRLVKRDMVSGFQAEKELSVQLPLVDKCLLADHVINNSGSWTRTLLGLLHLGKVLWPGS
ncbi:MAG: dephospho-CoA kinase [Thermodesulfobacteriota bacterium]